MIRSNGRKLRKGEFGSVQRPRPNRRHSEVEVFVSVRELADMTLAVWAHLNAINMPIGLDAARGVVLSSIRAVGFTLEIR